MMTRDEILRAALIGYEHKKTEIDAAMAEIQSELKAAVSPKSAIAAVPVTGKVRRKMSPEARARIAAATRKRWRAYRREQKKAA